VLAISEDADWNALRLGLGAAWTTPWHGLNVALEGAWLPYGALDANDDHWLRIRRTDLSTFNGPILQSGVARGLQLEGTATLPLTDAIDVGVGGRYWYLSSAATETRTSPFFGSSMNNATFSTRRAGAFAQVDLRF